MRHLRILAVGLGVALLLAAGYIVWKVLTGGIGT